MTIVTVSPRGNSFGVVIPSFYRKMLGWHPGTKLYLEIQGDALVLRRVPPAIEQRIADADLRRVGVDVSH